MKFIRTKILTFFLRISNGFIFFPSLIIVAILFVGLWVLSFEQLDELVEKVPFIVVHETATIRTILASFLTSLISITVFSFSMVMLVLNQASSNYSPRILNWMVGEKGNQYTLGVYLGTILLTILLLLQLPADKDAIPTFHLAVLFNALLTFYCLMLFVSLINRVSNDIQITNITENLFKKTEKRLRKEARSIANGGPPPQSTTWIQCVAQKSGYLQKVDQNALLSILVKNDLYFNINYSFGHYYISGVPLYSLNRKVEKSVLAEIESTFSFYSGEKIDDNAFFGFRQLSEIAVKALSPGINDPGTAHQCIDYLTHLFKIKMEYNESKTRKDEGGHQRIYIQNYSIEQLLIICMIPILRYGGNDGRILECLITFLKNLAGSGAADLYKKELAYFSNALTATISKNEEDSLLNNYSKDL